MNREKHVKLGSEHLVSVHGVTPVAQTVKNLPAMQETRVRSLSQEDPLEKRMAILSNILAWRTPWTEKPDGLQSVGSKRVRHTEQLTLHGVTVCVTLVFCQWWDL